AQRQPSIEWMQLGRWPLDLGLTQQGVGLGARLVDRLLGRLWKAVVVRMDADEGCVDRSESKVEVEEPLQPVVAGRTHRASGRSTQRRSWNDCSTALMIS